MSSVDGVIVPNILHALVFPVTTRDRDNGELRYSLRSLDKFAPWFRGDIIIVQGDDRPPSWLNLSHPRIRIVKHGSFFKDPSHLPTFNSDAIQVNLHRMAELGERFIYMNDDFFLGAPVKPTDWFQHGKPVMYFEKYVIRGGRAYAAELKAKKGNVWLSKIHNTLGLIDSAFPPAARQDIVVHFVKHAPQPVLRHVLEDMEKLWPEEYKRTSMARFRTYDTIDVSLLHQLYCQVLTPCGGLLAPTLRSLTLRTVCMLVKASGAHIYVAQTVEDALP